MQNYITLQQLRTLGIAVGDSELEALLVHLNDTIEERIGAEITDALDNEQLHELIIMQDAATEEELGAWIAKHVPDYQDIVQDNIDIAIGELAESTAVINASVA